jgi:hypothetical protein
MPGHFRKLFLGAVDKEKPPGTGNIRRKLKNIQVIWNNDQHDDVGIEKLLRLFLASSQFLFPGVYIKHFFSKFGRDMQVLAMDTYLLLKVLFPLVLCFLSLVSAQILLWVVVWLLMETLLYVPAMIFASDIYVRPPSYRRSMLLLFFNYLEIIFAYGFIYSNGNYLNLPFNNWYDPVYFSFITISTIGYGDYYPITGWGKFLVISQTMVFISFVVLFINFYSRRVESPGYFGEDSKNQARKESPD